MSRELTRVSVCVALAMLLSVPARAADKASPVGRQIAEFSLHDSAGKTRGLGDYADQKVVVVAFLGTECPLAKLYAPRLNELHKRFADQGVTFLGIDSNQQDSLAEVDHYRRTHAITFPLLKDGDSQVANLFGAERTPQVFVLDGQRVARYAGRIDDQYGYDRGVGYQRPEATHHNLADAIEDLLAGRAVKTPSTEVVGCLIGRPKTPDSTSPVTYTNQIARIFQNHCVECHRPGEIGPFSLLSYDDAVGWGEMIREVVDQGRMPPWGADPQFGHFKNDPSLSDEDKRLVAVWVENGCPQGDPANLPEPRQFVAGWGIPQPDQVINMADTAFTVPQEGTIEYQYFEVDPGWKQDVWVKAAEARPGNRSIVHHIIVFVKEPGSGAGLMEHGVGPSDLLTGYAPGMPPLRGFHGMGRKIKAGSKLIFQMHYTPNGTEQADLSCLGVVYAEPGEVTHDLRSGAAMQLKLEIPPGDDDYVARSKRKFRDDMVLISLMPHMHLRGKSFRYELESPDGTRETLLDVPRYDFNWQLVYILDKPRFIPAGSTLFCEAHYDNSEDNLANPDPTQLVRWGDQTWEEMMIGWFVAAKAQPEDKQKYASAEARSSSGGQ